MDRILDITESGCHIKIDQGRLLLRRESGDDVPVALADAAVVILANPRITVSQTALAAIAGAGGAVVVCDERRLPVSMMLPIASNTLTQERIDAQIHVSQPLCKQLWKRIASTKIRNQATVLAMLDRPTMGLEQMAKRVKSGDPENVEAQAARRYWPALFGDSFHRNPKGDGPNSLLNYGYAVLRAMVARAICASGLHPSIGIHHHNRYDSFTLADDLMEPLRPMVDLMAARIVGERGIDAALDPPAKRQLSEGFLGYVIVEGERRTVADACARMASSLVQVIAGQRKKMILPEMGVSHEVGKACAPENKQSGKDGEEG